MPFAGGLLCKRGGYREGACRREAVAGQSGTTNFVEASGASEEAIARRPAVIGGRLSRAEQNHELSASPLGPLDAKHPARRQPYSTTKSSRVISLS